MRILILKSEHRLTLTEEGRELLKARVGLGRVPQGAKCSEGDGKTPEGVYQICLAKENGKFGLSLGINYPNAEDARLAYTQGRIDLQTLHEIETAVTEGRRPPWGSPLGGEIHLHEGDTQSDSTAGCIALSAEDIAVLFDYRNQIEDVEIRP